MVNLTREKLNNYTVYIFIKNFKQLGEVKIRYRPGTYPPKLSGSKVETVVHHVVPVAFQPTQKTEDSSRTGLYPRFLTDHFLSRYQYLRTVFLPWRSKPTTEVALERQLGACNCLHWKRRRSRMREHRGHANRPLDDQSFNSWINSIFLVEDAFTRVATICGYIKENAGVTAHARDFLQPEIEINKPKREKIK